MPDRKTTARPRRKALTKKTRFEVFKRDKFTCQYCGQAAPDVVLEVDHITPVASGGGNDLLNLITACKPCNAGKLHRELSDDSAVAKQQRQLADLQERREQLAMMVKWRDGLDEIATEVEDHVVTYIARFLVGRSVNATGRKTIRTWLRRFSFAEICDAIKSAADARLPVAGDASDEQAQAFFALVPRIAAVARQAKNQPYIRDLYYIRGICRNRFQYANLTQAKTLLSEAFEVGYTAEQLKGLALECRNWAQWRDLMESWIEHARAAATER